MQRIIYIYIYRKEKDTCNYTCFFHNLEVSPLHFQGEFAKINIWLQMFKHTSKRFQILKHASKRFSMLKHKSKRLLSKHNNYTEKCLGWTLWYTISCVHNTNQIQTLETLEFLRYESLYEILSMWHTIILAEFWHFQNVVESL